MGLFDVFRNAEESSAYVSTAAENDDLKNEQRYLMGRVDDLEESMLRISDSFDNIGWSPLPEDEANELPLGTVKKAAEVARALHAVNPFVKRGVAARVGYIWGKGITFDGIDDIQDEIDLNRHKLFSTQAYHELERVLSTDGNAFTALNIDPTSKDGAFRVPLNEIVGSVSNPLDKEEIWYYKREYMVEKTNSQTGKVDKDTVTKYYPSIGYYQKIKDVKALPKRWNKVGVEQNYVIHHIAVNKQVGWRWGVPDIMPVIFWAKAYKEYLEDNAQLVKAYSRLAWQVKSPSLAGGQAAGAQIMAPPSRDPITGELRAIGGTAISGIGGELSPVDAKGSTVDFTKGAPLASAIAAGLEVPLTVLTSDAGSSNRSGAESLDLPTLKAMETRQQLHSDRFLEIFEFWGADITPPKDSAKPKSKDIQEALPGIPLSSTNALNAKPVNATAKLKPSTEPTGSSYAIVTWPQIETDATKDRIAAIGTAVELGILFKQEARKETIDVLGIAPYKPWDELPTMADDPAAAEKFQQEQDQFAQQAEAAQKEASVIAKQGVSGGVAAKGGKQSTNNQARDSRAANQKNS